MFRSTEFPLERLDLGKLALPQPVPPPSPVRSVYKTDPKDTHKTIFSTCPQSRIFDPHPVHTRGTSRIGVTYKIQP